MSPLLQVGLTDVSHEGPSQMEPGVYTLESIKADVIPPAEDKAAQIRVTFKNANAPEGDESTVLKIFALSEKAKPYLKRFLMAARAKDLSEADEIDTDQLVGLTCEAAVSSQSWCNKDTGEPQKGANITKFIIPVDMLPAQ